MEQDDVTILFVPAKSQLAELAFALRHDVFVGEQQVPVELEFDELDPGALHLVALHRGDVAGTLRIVRQPDHAKIGRVAVRQDRRRMGIARRMMQEAMQHSRTRGQDRFYLTAQCDKLALYRELGFREYGEEFLDAGIPHLAMKTY